MKWISDEITAAVSKKLEYLLPYDFDHLKYISLNPDLKDAGICDYQSAKEHYLFFGLTECRQYKEEILVDTPNEMKKERFFNSKNLLYLSPTAPDFDRSSGGLRLLEILTILSKNLKYNIYFLCHDKVDIKYFYKLMSMGIFCYSLDNKISLVYYFDMFKQKNINFDNCIISWYDMGRQYIDIIKEFYPDIKIITDSVDVHWLRETRGVEANEINYDNSSLEIRKTAEKNVYLKSDTVFAVTESDKYEIHRELGYHINVKVLSNIHNEYSDNNIGKNILFVGNYKHSPNIKAIEKCINIYSKFKDSEEWAIDKPQLIIAGYGIPDKIINCANTTQGIKILGYIEDLETSYKDSMVMMAPLDWGAGIKGKICDAAMRSLVILTSDIGNEGISLIDNNSGYIANTIDEFVKKLKDIYSQPKENIDKIRFLGKQKIQSLVSRNSASVTLLNTLQDKHIVISIIAYKNHDKLQKCLESLINKSGYSNYTIEIVDNSDKNYNKNVFKSIRKKYPDVDIVYTKNNTNEYFILPNNKIINKYPKSDILLVNDDIEIITNNFLSLFYSSAYSYYNIAAVGAKTIFPNGTLAEAGAELYQNGYGNNIGRGRNPKELCYNIPKFVGYCSGCLLYMTRDAIDKIGGFDTTLEKMYYEDSEWQYRAHLSGLKTLYQPLCEAIHDEGSSAGKNISTGAKKYQEINRLKFVDKYQNVDINALNP